MSLAIRTSVVRTFGFIVFVIGLVLTIYGHIAGRSCTNCDLEGGEAEYSNRKQHVIYDQPYRETLVGKEAYVKKLPSLDHKNAPSPTSPPVNRNAINYAKMLGPIGLVIGLVFIALSIIINRLLKVKDSSDIRHKIHWTDELIDDHQRFQGIEADETVIHINAQTQTQVYMTTSISIEDLPKTSIVDPPPAYEDTVINLVIRAQANGKIICFCFHFFI
jgi:hypothetical protein